MEMIDKFVQMMQKDIDKHFDNEIRKIFGISEVSKQTTSEDVISYFKGMIYTMTTLIICSPKNKELLDERKDELPRMTEIYTNPYLKDDKLYLITDEELKASILEGMRMNKKFGFDKG